MNRIGERLWEAIGLRARILAEYEPNKSLQDAYIMFFRRTRKERA